VVLHKDDQFLHGERTWEKERLIPEQARNLGKIA